MEHMELFLKHNVGQTTITLLEKKYKRFIEINFKTKVKINQTLLLNELKKYDYVEITQNGCASCPPRVKIKESANNGD